MTIYRRKDSRAPSIMISKDETATMEDGNSELLPLSGLPNIPDSGTAHHDNDDDANHSKQIFEIHPHLDKGSNSTQFSAYDEMDTEIIPSWLGYFPKSVVEFFFPANVPRSVQLFRKENIAIPLCYLFVGLVRLSNVKLNVIVLYFIHINNCVSIVSIHFYTCSYKEYQGRLFMCSKCLVLLCRNPENNFITSTCTHNKSILVAHSF